MVYVGDSIDIGYVPKLALLCEQLQKDFPDLVNIIPSYTSIMVEFHPSYDVSKLTQYLSKMLDQFDQLKASSQQKLIELPTYYHPDVAPDLITLAQQKKLSIEEVIAIHTNQEYTVCAIGFTPGFAFLGVIDERIAHPRHEEPRLQVAKGSVGIADQQTAVYPSNSPGGWQIIGNCPVSLFDPHSTPITPFNVGDTVKFVSIDKQEFLALGGVIEHSKERVK